MAKSHPSDYIDFDAGREGYFESGKQFVPDVILHKPANNSPGSGTLLSIRTEERLGSLVAACGTIWSVYVGTMDYNNLWRMQFAPPGPIEVCALGILIWLHAKWRRSNKN